MASEEDQLAERAQQGDRDAGSLLIDRFYRPIYAYLFRLCGREEEAKDLTQTTFIKVWSSIESYDPKRPFKGWLFRIAHNVFVDWKRRQNWTVSPSEGFWDVIPNPALGPFASLAEQETLHILEQCLQQLDEHLRETVYLRFLNGLSLQETAMALQVAVPTVKYRLRIALARLKKQLSRWGVSGKISPPTHR